MTKLPDNHDLLKLYRDGLSDSQIADMYGATQQAVNKRLKGLGIEREPYTNAAKALINLVWPSSELPRGTASTKAGVRNLYVYLRWRLGDPKLTARALAEARLFAERLVREDVVLDFDPAAERQWVYVPREERDGRLVVRLPEGRVLPEGDQVKALNLP